MPERKKRAFGHLDESLLSYIPFCIQDDPGGKEEVPERYMEYVEKPPTPPTKVAL